jgi:regulator of protease activity HflC (stomatin/prohibitin superfamily)
MSDQESSGSLRNIRPRSGSAPRGAGWFMLAVLVGILVVSSIRVVPAGFVGVRVTFGEVSDTVLGSGLHFVPFYSHIVRYDSRIRNYTMSAAHSEGNVQGNDAVQAASSDQLMLQVDVTVLYRIDGQQAPWIHQNLGVRYEDAIIRPKARESVRNAVAQFTGMEAYATKRAELKTVIQQMLTSELTAYAVNVDEVNLRDVNPPQEVVNAISAKATAMQDAERMRFVLQKTEQEAKVKVAEAEGLAKAQTIIQEKLTPLYVQHEAIKAYERLAGAPNTTFVIMPTSTQGAGLPLIISPDGAGQKAVGQSH